jgi:putative hydrolase of HD superfamily
MKDTRNGILHFLKHAERLKDTCRFAYTSNGRPKSAAAHTWRVCLLAVVLEEQYPQLDSGRLLKLCLVHDLGEALGEDVPAPEQDERAEAGGNPKTSAGLSLRLSIRFRRH